jgi:hypothetical protein
LAGQCHQPGHGQNEADIDLRPLLRCQIDGNEGAKAGLDIGDEENEPIETMQRPP